MSFLGALSTSAAYVTAFGRAMNRVQETEEGRPLVKYRALMLGVTVALLVVSVVMVGMLLLTDDGARALGQQLGLGDTTLVVWAIVKWPLLAALLTGIIGCSTRRPRTSAVAGWTCSPGAASWRSSPGASAPPASSGT